MRQSTGLALGYDTPVLTAYVPASATELTFFARHRGWWEFAFYGDSSGRSSECRVQRRPFTLPLDPLSFRICDFSIGFCPGIGFIMGVFEL